MVYLILDTLASSGADNKLISSRALSKKTPLDMLLSQPSLNKDLAATFIQVMIDDDHKSSSVDAAIIFHDRYRLERQSVACSCEKRLREILHTICQSDNAVSLMWFLETEVKVNIPQYNPKDLSAEALQKNRDSMQAKRVLYAQATRENASVFVLYEHQVLTMRQISLLPDNKIE